MTLSRSVLVAAVGVAGLLACRHGTPTPAAPAPAAAAPSPEPAPASPTLTGPPPVPTPPPGTIPPLPAVAAPADEVFEGWKLFHIHCFRCHGFDAEGAGAPNLRETVKTRLTRSGFIVTVLGGRPERGMPVWGEVLQPQDAERIYQYIVERATGRLGPGRPPSS